MWLLSCLKMESRAGPGLIPVHPLAWPPQHVPEHGATDLGLDFSVSLASNVNQGVGSRSARAT